MPKVISRKDALALGLGRYFTGKPCKRGHIDERWVASPQCVSCKRLDGERWRENNPEKVKESRRRTHIKHRQKDLEVGRVWYRKNRAKHLAKSKAWAQSHPEKMREYSRKSYWNNRDSERARRRREYYDGPKNPKGQSQWRKSLAQLRAVKRLLRGYPPGLRQSPSAESMMSTDLRKSCPR